MNVMVVVSSREFRATLDAKIRQGIADYEAGKVYRMNDGESTEDYLGRMISEKWYVHHRFLRRREERPEGT